MLNSARLTYTLITYEDHDDVHATLNDQNTCDMLSFMRWPLTDEQVTYWCDKAVKGAQTRKELLFIARNGHTAIGCIGLHNEENNINALRVGYWVGATHQKQGYASEMLHKIIKYAQNTLNIKHLNATAATDNHASAALLLKHGFVLSGNRTVESKNNAPRPSKLFTLETKSCA